MEKTQAALVLAVAACISATTAAHAENWVAFFVIPEGVVYLDRDSVTRSPGQVSARLESTFPRPQRLQHDGSVFSFIRVVDRVELDCRARIYINVSRDLYSDIGIQQLSIYDANNPLPIAPKSAQDALTKAFCS